MERAVKLRVKVDYATYSALKEVEGEYREVLEEAIIMGCQTRLPPSLELNLEFTRLRGRSTRTYPPIILTQLVRTLARGWTALRR